MKNQALFSLKDKGKTLKFHLLQFLLGTLRVKNIELLVCLWTFGMIEDSKDLSE